MAQQLDGRYVLTLARRITGKFRGRFPHGVSAADAEQEAALLVLERAPQYEQRVAHKDHPPGFEAWIVKHVWGVLMDKYQRDWREQWQVGGCQLDATFAPSANHPALASADPSETTPLNVDLQAALATLTPVERAAVEAHGRGESQADIGATLGYTQSYVSQIIARAHKKLRVVLADYSDAGDSE